MSITVTSIPVEPEQQTPYRPLFIDCSSDSANITRIIADVYVSGTLQTTVEKDPELGTTDQFRIELGDIATKYLVSEWNEPSSFLETYSDTTSALFFDITIFEVETISGVVTTTWAENGAGTLGLSTDNIYVFNGVNQHLQTVESRRADGITKKFLTNRPQNSKILNNRDYFAGYYQM